MRCVFCRSARFAWQVVLWNKACYKPTDPIVVETQRSILHRGKEVSTLKTDSETTLRTEMQQYRLQGVHLQVLSSLAAWGSGIRQFGMEPTLHSVLRGLTLKLKHIFHITWQKANAKEVFISETVEVHTSVVLVMWAASPTWDAFMVAPRRTPDKGLRSQKTHILPNKRLSDSAIWPRKLCPVKLPPTTVPKLMITMSLYSRNTAKVTQHALSSAKGDDKFQMRGLEPHGEEDQLWFAGATFTPHALVTGRLTPFKMIPIQQCSLQGRFLRVGIKTHEDSDQCKKQSEKATIIFNTIFYQINNS